MSQDCYALLVPVRWQPDACVYEFLSCLTSIMQTQSDQLQHCRQKVVVCCSLLPLSIVMVGVGDGPWEMMREFDDNLPTRQFDNFQFVNHTELMSKYGHLRDQQREAAFAVAALQEIPDQYRVCRCISCTYTYCVVCMFYAAPGCIPVQGCRANAFMYLHASHVFVCMKATCARLPAM